MITAHRYFQHGQWRGRGVVRQVDAAQQMISPAGMTSAGAPSAGRADDGKAQALTAALLIVMKLYAPVMLPVQCFLRCLDQEALRPSTGCKTLRGALRGPLMSDRRDGYLPGLRLSGAR